MWSVSLSHHGLQVLRLDGGQLLLQETGALEARQEGAEQRCWI